MNKKRFQKDTDEEYVLFRKVSPHYDTLEKTVAKQVKQFIKKSSFKNFNAVDLGCGTGMTFKWVLDLNLKIKIDCVDNEIKMLDQAKAIYKSSKDLKFFHEDMLSYLKTQKDNSKQIIFSGIAIHNCKKNYREKIYYEIFRVLDKKGIFINADKIAKNNFSEHRLDYKWQTDMFKIFSKYGRQDLEKRWTEHYKLDNSKEFRLTEKEFENGLSEAGFTNIKKVFRKKLEATYIAIK